MFLGLTDEVFSGLSDEPIMMDSDNADVTTEPIIKSSNVSPEVDCETVGMYGMN